MTSSVSCEPLDARRLYAATPAFDPAYLFTAAALRRAAGPEATVVSAVAAPGERTILLAMRSGDRTPDPVDFGDETLYLTLLAVTKDGKPDRTFGTDGIVLTGRGTENSILAGSILASPVVLRVDDAGRIYVADGQRVLRFRKNGTPDAAFGDRGVMQFTSDRRPVRLCDLMPADDGVYVATTATKNGVATVAVQFAGGKRLRTVFSAADDLGVPSLGGDGASTDLRFGDAVFARSAGGVAMARMVEDVKEYTIVDDGFGPMTYTRPVFQEIVVTRFGESGRGVDVARIEARGDPGFGAVLGTMVLSPTAKTALVQTDREVLRLSLNARTGRRYDLPDITDDFQTGYELLPDGKLYRSERSNDQETTYTVARFLPTGQADTAFAKGGVLAFNSSDLAGDLEEAYDSLDSIYLSASGRLHVVSYGNSVEGRSLTIRRL